MLNLPPFFISYEQLATSNGLAIAVSGGPDSMALLLMLHEYTKNITALTVDHGLRPESKNEALQVQLWCKELGIAHHILEWKPTSSLQEVARDARYQLMTDWCKKNNVAALLTAHHRGDQAETLFFRLARGSNLRGLACIQPESEMHGVRIVRPLLDVGKKQLIEYLHKNHQPWIEDPSNTKRDYTRNVIRSQLVALPDAENIEARAADVARFFLHLRKLIDEKTDAACATAVKITGKKAALNQKTYAALPTEIAHELLARLICRLTENDHPPRTKKLERLHRWCTAPDRHCVHLAHLVFVYEKKQAVIDIYPSKSLEP